MGILQSNVVFEPFQREHCSEMCFLNHFKECEKMLCLFFFFNIEVQDERFEDIFSKCFMEKARVDRLKAPFPRI